MTQAYKKWEPTGLLQGLEHFKATKMAELLEMSAIWLARHPSFQNPVGPTLFPVVRRVFGALEYRIVDHRLDPVHILNVTHERLISESMFYEDADAELIMCETLASMLIAAFQEYGEIEISSEPLKIKPYFYGNEMCYSISSNFRPVYSK